MLGFLTKGSNARSSLLFGSATHVWNDLFVALLIPLLPLIRADPELSLSYTEAGLLRSVYTGATAVLQMPAGFLAERTGEFWLLIGGNAWMAVGLVVMAAAPAYLPLLLSALLTGLGGGAQHPLASSMVSRAYDARGRSTAVGTVNFAGDLGKLVAPAVALMVAIRYGWRGTMRLVGIAGIAFMLLFVFARRAVETGKPAQAEADSQGSPDGDALMGGFITLSAVGFLDTVARTGAMTFLPFVMESRGMSTQQIFVMLIFLLAGGAVGKFACGWLDDRYGSVRLIWGTKGLAALLLVAILHVPTPMMAPLVVLLGVGLNGTSSVLYGTLAAFIPNRQRARFYGRYYTTNEGGGILAPLLFGRVADLVSIRAAILAVGLASALILPASQPLGAYLARVNPKPPSGDLPDGHP